MAKIRLVSFSTCRGCCCKISQIFGNIGHCHLDFRFVNHICKVARCKKNFLNWSSAACVALLYMSFLQQTVLPLDERLFYSFLCCPWTFLVYSSSCYPWMLCSAAPCAVPEHVFLVCSISTVPKGVWPTAACASPGSICLAAACKVPGEARPTRARCT